MSNHHTPFFGALAITAALALAQPVVTSIFNPTSVFAASTVEVDTEAEFLTALADPTVSTIKLATSLYFINSTATEQTATFNINRDLILDLSGENIRSEFAGNIFTVSKGHLQIINGGRITSNATDANVFDLSGTSDSNATNYTTLSTDTTTEIYAEHGHTINITPAANVSHGITLNIGGELASSYGNQTAIYYNIANDAQAEFNNTFNINDGAKVYGGLFAIDARSSATWNIGAAEIAAPTVFYIEAGDFNLKTPKTLSVGTRTEVANPASRTPSGAIFQIAYGLGEINININGGEYATYRNGDIFYAYPFQAGATAPQGMVHIVDGGFETDEEGAQIFNGLKPGVVTVENFAVVDAVTTMEEFLAFLTAGTVLVEFIDADSPEYPHIYVTEKSIYNDLILNNNNIVKGRTMVAPELPKVPDTGANQSATGSATFAASLAAILAASALALTAWNRTRTKKIKLA